MAPTIRALYEDPEVLRGNPIFAAMDEMLSKAVARPAAKTGKQYRQVSQMLWEATHDVLSGKQPASKRLAELEQQLTDTRGAAW